jgi:hypothetical protein
VFCGKTPPAPFVPGLNVVMLTMRTNSIVQQTGFDLNFTTVQSKQLNIAMLSKSYSVFGEKIVAIN